MAESTKKKGQAGEIQKDLQIQVVTPEVGDIALI